MTRREPPRWLRLLVTLIVAGTLGYLVTFILLITYLTENGVIR